MDDQYSPCTALLYVFNLVVGTGTLTLPKAFSQAGWIFSIVLMFFLAFVSYMTVTFVIEAMSSCNAIIQWTKVDSMKRVTNYLRTAINDRDSDDEGNGDSEDDMLLPSEYIYNFPTQPERYFTIDRKIELSEMSVLLYNRFGQILFYIVLCLYLFGDLTIYTAAVGKSLVDATCYTNSSNITDNDICWNGVSLSRKNVYQIYLAGFLILFGPYAYFNVQKTKVLQIFTSLTRWLAFAMMVGLTIMRLTSDKPHGNPNKAVPSGLPALLGACVYSFMCHHSLPGMLSPMTDKTRLFRYLAFTYTVILVFYLTLAVPAVFAFPTLEDLYTLNFAPYPGAPVSLEIVNYFLTLYPVFTLSASFPIIAVTLRSNFQAMFSQYESWAFQKVFLPSLAVVPPILVALTTENIEFLVGITGSYAGVGIQYIIPATLVLLSRNSVPPSISRLPNHHTSPFKSQFWPYLVICWACLCIVVVSYNIIRSL